MISHIKLKYQPGPQFNISSFAVGNILNTGVTALISMLNPLEWSLNPLPSNLKCHKWHCTQLHCFLDSYWRYWSWQAIPQNLYRLTSPECTEMKYSKGALYTVCPLQSRHVQLRTRCSQKETFTGMIIKSKFNERLENAMLVTPGHNLTITTSMQLCSIILSSSNLIYLFLVG